MILRLDETKINGLQLASIRRLIDRAKHAHVTDIHIRINGAWEVVEADWLKHLELSESKPPAPHTHGPASDCELCRRPL